MTDLLTALSVIFIIVGPTLLVAKRLRMAIVPALIVSGLLAGLFIEEGITIELARLGIALLVFTFSISIQTDTLRTVVSDSEIVALWQATLLGVLGIGVGMILGLAPAQALYIGIAAALSSTIVGTALFQSPDRDLVHDYLSNSIHSFQDLLALLILLVLGAGTFGADPIATQLGYGIMLLVGALVINRYLFDLVLRITRASNESKLVGVIALLIVFLGLAEAVGVSIVVGAFAAGLAVRDDPVNYSDVLNGLESIKDFFAAIFFVTVGALVTVPTLEVFTLAFGLAVLTSLVKPAVVVAMLVYKGYDRRAATLTGLNLDHVGEFAIIVAIEAFVLGILLDWVFEAIILAAAVTMVVSSFTHYYDEQIYQAFVDSGWLGQPHHNIDDWNTVPEDISDHFVIVGYGRQGRVIVDFCEEVGQPYVVIENNPELIDDLRRQCDAYVFGDAIEDETAHVANIEDAQLVISTGDSKPLNEHFLSFKDSVDVIVRASDVTEAPSFIERGAIYVIVPDLLAADHLAENLAPLVNGEYDREHLRERSLQELDAESAPPRPSTAESKRMF